MIQIKLTKKNYLVLEKKLAHIIKLHKYMYMCTSYFF